MISMKNLKDSGCKTVTREDKEYSETLEAHPEPDDHRLACVTHAREQVVVLPANGVWCPNPVISGCRPEK